MLQKLLLERIRFCIEKCKELNAQWAFGDECAQNQWYWYHGQFELAKEILKVLGIEVKETLELVINWTAEEMNCAKQNAEKRTEAELKNPMSKFCS